MLLNSNYNFAPSIALFGFLLYYHWEAQLITNLSVKTIVLPFKSIPELVSKTDFKIATYPGTAYEAAFKTSTDPDWQVAWKSRMEPYLDLYEKYLPTNDLENLLLVEEEMAFYDVFDVVV